MTRDTRPELKKKARELYLQDLPSRYIAGELGVSKTTVTAWCRDLAAMRRALAHQRRSDSTSPLDTQDENYIAALKADEEFILLNKKNQRTLTNKNVIDMRRQAKLDGQINLSLHAKRYNVSISAISLAMRGITFPELNIIESPIDNQSLHPVTKLKKRVDESIIDQAIAMCRDHPEEWTYAKLAAWVETQTGKKYKANHLSILFSNRAPDLVVVLGNKAKDAQRIKTKKILTPEQKFKRAAAAQARKESLRLYTQEANRLEREVNAGLR